MVAGDITKKKRRRPSFWLSFCAVSILGARTGDAAKPPIRDSSAALSDAWAQAATGFEHCSSEATAGDRAGTLWVDILFPADHGNPTWKIRSSAGLTATDRACAHKVIVSSVLPALLGNYGFVDQPISTMELGLGRSTRYLPSLRSFLPTWLALSRAPSSDAKREQLRRGVGPMAKVANDSCLQVRREERLQAARRDWLAEGGRQVSHVWTAFVEGLGRKQRVTEPVAYLVDRVLLVSGARFDTSVHYTIRGSSGSASTAPDPWSRRYETYCVREIDTVLSREIDREISDVAIGIADDGLDRLVAPRLASPPGKKLHALAVADSRTCALDETGAIVCYGIRDGAPPQGAFAALALDDRYACAIRSSGEFACWGEPALGASAPAGRFTRVSVAGSGACAVSDRHAIVCWGTHSSWIPPAGDFVDVALTLSGGHAVTADGTLVSWGAYPARRSANAAHVVGSSCETCVITRAAAVDCADQKGQRGSIAGPVRAFAPGCPAGCGIRADGSLDCAGDRAAAPPPAVAAARYAEISSSDSRFCGTTVVGELTCWGKSWPGNWVGRPIKTRGTP